MEDQVRCQRRADTHGGRNMDLPGAQPGRTIFSFRRSKESTTNDKQKGYIAMGMQETQGIYLYVSIPYHRLQELMVHGGDQPTANPGSLQP